MVHRVPSLFVHLVSELRRFCTASEWVWMDVPAILDDFPATTLLETHPNRPTHPRRSAVAPEPGDCPEHEFQKFFQKKGSDFDYEFPEISAEIR